MKKAIDRAGAARSGLRLRRMAFVAAAVMLGSLILGALPAQAESDVLQQGRRIYDQSCALCHGDEAEGVQGLYPRPLAGNMSLAQLTQYIERWMPEEDPDEVVGEDAEQVAQYIYTEFYSPLAQARNRAARVELARLTADQHRNAVADLIDSFRSPRSLGDERGLRAEYFNDRRPGSRSNRVAERIDEQVKLHFVGGAEVADGLEPTGFAARWRGSLIAPKTGTYELIIQTDYGARLWLNDMDEALIDAWVSSVGETEHRASIFLIGGQAYPLRLDFTSRDQGVNRDPDDETPIEGFIELQWRQPKYAPEVIHPRYLSPDSAEEVFVAQTAFPPEDRSVGYERGSSVSKAWHRASTNVAIEAAGYVVRHLNGLAGEGEQELRSFAAQFVERAFRKPLEEEQRARYVDRQFENSPNAEEAVRRIVLLTLMSPRFLYLDFGGEQPDGFEVAARLSFTLWDSIPDRELWQAAEQGRLAEPDEVLRQAQRMVDDLRSRHKMRQFVHHWLHLEHNEDASKSSEYFPDFDERMVSDLRTSLYLFIEDVLWGDEPDFRKLIEADYLFINGRLAEYYGFDLPADAPFQMIEADQPQRRGVVSHPYVMAVYAYHDVTSPIHRGVIMARGMLGRTLRPPPEAFTPEPADLHPELTTRERIARQTAPAACISCHSLINPLGFTLEHFDAVGRFRLTEDDHPIDSTGGYEMPSGEMEEFQDARDLAAYIASSEEAHEAFVLQLFHHLVKQPIRGYGQDRPAEMAEAFAARDYDIRGLMADIAATVALWDQSQQQLAEHSR